METLIDAIAANLGSWAPPAMVLTFLVASLVIVWRLEAMMQKGVKGTVLGTLFMPYFSGLGNLLFVFIALRDETLGGEVFRNVAVNNLTNLTLILGGLGLLVIITFRESSRTKKKLQEAKLNRLSISLSLLAMIFFAFFTWALGRDGTLNEGDGFALIAVFIFWQAFHVYEVLRDNAKGDTGWSPSIWLDLLVIGGASAATLVSIEYLVAWILTLDGRFLSADNLGLLTGLLMVMPNAMLAGIYAIRGRAEIAYASQIGDGHICIPLALGIYASFHPLALTTEALWALQLLAVISALHLCFVIFKKSIPRAFGGFLVVCYGGLLGTGRL
ncbi:MAG: sodium:calcium symporter [Puniceicoccaceae bacterium]